MRLLPFFIVPAILCTCSLFAQPAVNNYPDEYILRPENDAVLFNGKVQKPMPGNIDGIYLGEHEAVQGKDIHATGDLFYDGVRYRDVKMRLDLFRDELMVLAPNNSIHGILLDPLRLGYADFYGHRVIYAPGGYHVQLYGGAREALKKESYSLDPLTMEFKDRTLKYYIRKDGTMHQVRRTKGSILRVLGDRRGELKRFIRANDISVWRDTDGALVRIVSEYERLIGAKPGAKQSAL